MTVSRREFLKAGTAIAFGAGLPLTLLGPAAAQSANSAQAESGAYFAIPERSLKDPLGSFTMATFAGLLHNRFQLRVQRNRQIQLTLINVTDLASSAPLTSEEECFSLLFRAPRGRESLRQNTYTMEHPALGAFRLFVVPMGGDRHARYYEAVINRRRS
jgi:hypothetical protein